jgi:hypothetical protein
MAQDHNDIYSIVERLRVLEEGLDKNQRSVNQLGATFKPKTVAVLTAKTDPKNPLGGKMVGGCEESVDREVAEDVLNKVKKSFTDYIKNLEDEIKTDSDLKDKHQVDTDLRAKDKKDRDLIAKVDKRLATMDESPTGEEPTIQAPTQPTINPTLPEEEDIAVGIDAVADAALGNPIPESSPVKTITNECGLWEVHGDEHQGFELRHGARRLPTRFKQLSDAEIALEMFMKRRQKQDDSQDYIDEA